MSASARLSFFGRFLLVFGIVLAAYRWRSDGAEYALVLLGIFLAVSLPAIAAPWVVRRVRLRHDGFLVEDVEYVPGEGIREAARTAVVLPGHALPAEVEEQRERTIEEGVDKAVEMVSAVEAAARTVRELAANPGVESVRIVFRAAPSVRPLTLESGADGAVQSVERRLFGSSVERIVLKPDGTSTLPWSTSGGPASA